MQKTPTTVNQNKGYLLLSLNQSLLDKGIISHEIKLTIDKDIKRKYKIIRS